MSRVEILENNEWKKHSTHKNEDMAVINAEVAHKSKRCPVRVVTEGKITWSR